MTADLWSIYYSVFFKIFPGDIYKKETKMDQATATCKWCGKKIIRNKYGRWEDEEPFLPYICTGIGLKTIRTDNSYYHVPKEVTENASM